MPDEIALYTWIRLRMVQRFEDAPYKWTGFTDGVFDELAEAALVGVEDAERVGG